MPKAIPITTNLTPAHTVRSGIIDQLNVLESELTGIDEQFNQLPPNESIKDKAPEVVALFPVTALMTIPDYRRWVGYMREYLYNRRNAVTIEIEALSRLAVYLDTPEPTN